MTVGERRRTVGPPHSLPEKNARLEKIYDVEERPRADTHLDVRNSREAPKGGGSRHGRWCVCGRKEVYLQGVEEVVIVNREVLPLERAGRTLVRLKRFCS